MNRRGPENAEDARSFKELAPSLNRLTERVIGAAIEVHRELGPGYLEGTYEEAMCFELSKQSIPFLRQYRFNTFYKGHPVGEGRVDLLVENTLLVELKAVEELIAIHRAQTIAYLRALDKPLGLLINFNVPLLRHGIRRIILSG